MSGSATIPAVAMTVITAVRPPARPHDLIRSVLVVAGNGSESRTGRGQHYPAGRQEPW